MLKPSPDPGLVSLSTSVYRILLGFYPAQFSQAYGPHMAQVFRDYCLKTYRQSGSAGIFSLWIITLFDFFSSLVEEHLQRETEMTKERFIKYTFIKITIT